MVEPAGPPPTTSTSQSNAAGKAGAGAGVAGGRDMIRCDPVAAAATVQPRGRIGRILSSRPGPPRAQDLAAGRLSRRQGLELGQRFGRGGVGHERRMRARGTTSGILDWTNSQTTATVTPACVIASRPVASGVRTSSASSVASAAPSWPRTRSSHGGCCFSAGRRVVS